jgi:histidinol-phosphate aminotransferase
VSSTPVPILNCLRQDLPAASSFTIAEIPHRAKLDQNESPIDLPADLKADLLKELAAAPWHRYPQPAQYKAAKKAFAEALKLAPETVALTVGGDQTIQAAFLLAGGPSRRARWFEPTYPFIPLMSRVTGTIGEGVILGADLEAKLDNATVIASPAPQLIVLVQPNNPTGGIPPRAVLDAALADDARMVFVDEAYADFAGESVVSLVPSRPNLLVGRSLSKALLAGVRLGYAVGHPETIDAIERIYTAPYHLNLLQLIVAARYGELRPHLAASVAQVVAERERVFTALQTIAGVTPIPSRANFILFALADRATAAAAHEALLAAGVRVRDASRLPGLRAHLRVTIGTREENDLFLSALAAHGAEGGGRAHAEQA